LNIEGEKMSPTSIVEVMDEFRFGREGFRGGHLLQIDL
jgi:hypothetical protein